MNTSHFLDWVYTYDLEKTKIAYSKFKNRCTCNGCTNLFAVFDESNPFPKNIQKLFLTVGIDYKALVNGVPHYFDSSRSQFLYSGWYHFIGKLVDGPDVRLIDYGNAKALNYHFIEVDENTSIAFHSGKDIAQVLFEPEDFDNLVQIQFTIWTDWIKGEIDALDIV